MSRGCIRLLLPARYALAAMALLPGLLECSSTSSKSETASCSPGEVVDCSHVSGCTAKKLCEPSRVFGPCACLDAGAGGSAGTGGAGSGGTGGSAAADGGPGGSAGDAGTTPCTAPTDCPGVDDDCTERVCDNRRCGQKHASAGSPVLAQTAGDCRKNECDGSGKVRAVADDGDAPDDGKQCTSDACNGGVPGHMTITGAECSEASGTRCNDAGQCVECVAAADCATNVCNESFRCAPAWCNDSLTNGNETDTDCGGGDCLRCDVGRTCNAGTDCKTGTCSGTCLSD